MIREIENIMNLAHEYLRKAESSANRMKDTDRKLSMAVRDVNSNLRYRLATGAMVQEKLEDSIEIRNLEYQLTMQENETVTYLSVCLSFLNELLNIVIDSDDRNLQNRLTLQVGGVTLILNNNKFTHSSLSSLAALSAGMEARILINDNFRFFGLRRQITSLRMSLDNKKW